jgi:hypothetical protein
VPADPIPRAASLEVALGSHADGTLWRPVQPTGGTRYQYDDRMPPTPGEAEIRRRWPVAAWEARPGDCLAFHVGLLHGAPGGLLPGGRRRVAAFLWAGDDARYELRPGRNMPPLPVAGVEHGGRLESARFPRVWPRPVPADLLALRPERPARPAD